MSKPGDISQEAWDAASEAWEAMTRTVICRDAETEVIARAILAEREACALIAKGMSNPYTGSARRIAKEHGNAICDAIRQGGEG